MKHTRQDKLREHKRLMFITNIKGLLRIGKVKEAVSCAAHGNISALEFGIIVKEVQSE